VDWLSLLQFAFSGLALVALAGTALAVGFTSIYGLLDGSSTLEDSIPLLSRATGFGLAAILVLPSAGLALLKLLSRSFPSPTFLKNWRNPVFYWVSLAFIALAWGLSIALLGWVSQPNSILVLLQPLLYLVAGALPIAFILLLGSGSLPGGSPQRRWGAFTFSMAGTTLIIICLELAIFLFIGLIVAVVIVSQPQWLAELTRIAARLQSAQQLTPETLQRILRPLLVQPWVSYLVVGLTSGIIPLVEELFKPLPLWFLGKRSLNPSEGFVLGLVCGAGFAFFESMSMLSAISGDAWIGIGIGRAGTDLLHMVNAGLMGWALASTWQDGRYLRLALTYLGVCSLHGLWNLFSLAQGILPLVGPVDGLPLSWWQQASFTNGGLIVISVILLIFLLIFRQRLGRQERASLPGTIEASGGLN
jgi:hypothetical protein